MDMAWVVVVEKDNLFYRQIQEALEGIDPNLVVMRFIEVREFLMWLTQLEKKDPEILAKVPAPPLKGVVTEIEGWGFKDITLIQKVKPLLVKLGFAAQEDELCIFLSGHDHPKLEMKRYEHRFVNNFVFKPFDKLLLKQSLETALTGRVPVKKHHINNFKTEVKIEMLKSIRLTEVNEIGFGTISDQKVESDKITKYYADFLQTEQHRSAFARALQNNNVKGSTLYKINLGFFALDQQQSFNLQKMIKSQNQSRTLPTIGQQDAEFFFLQHESGQLCQQLAPSLERFYHGHFQSVDTVDKLLDVLKTRRALASAAVFYVFVDCSFWLGNEVAEIKILKELQQGGDIQLFALSSRVFPEAQEIEMSEVCADIFYSPFNRSYIIKSLKFRWPALANKEDIFIGFGDFDQVIHASNPVGLKEVSEAGLVLQYYRELPVGTFREFILWMPNEVNTPTLLGQCNFVEFDKEKKIYNCHFIFFGMKDYHLKHIRLWILHNYIEAKKSEGS